MFKRFIFVLIVFLGIQSQAQNLQGTVSDSTGTVSYANVLIKKTKTPNLVFQFTTTNENGFYKLQLKEPLDSIYIEVTSMVHESKQVLLIDLFKEQNVTQNFHLQGRATSIREVIIEKNIAIRERNDTVTYNPDSFRDGSERVIEDLLKKLPGIKVEESGEIKYKGKSIKKFLLDGDDLFDSQYAIGSRNIDVDMVEKVQAIENFNENALLKGLINSDEVAINLQLKKGKTDFLGSTTLGYGIQDKYNGRFTGMFINQKIKGFATAAYNNIGNNTTPYDFQSSVNSVEMLSEEHLQAKEFINQGSFYSQIENKYHRVNDNFYASSNLLYKISKKLTIKTNFGFYDDKLTRQNNSFSQYTIGEENFTINQVENLTKKPRLYNISTFLEHKALDNMTWDYVGKLNYQEIDFISNSINNETSQKNIVNSTNFFTKHNFNLTKRINENTAFLINSVYAKSRAPQYFILSPGLNIDDNYIGNSILNNQDSRFEKETFKLRLDYYKSFEQLKWRVIGDYTSVSNDLHSLLTSIEENGFVFTDDLYQNDMKYNYNLPSLFTSLSYVIKDKYGFGLGLQGQYYNFLLDDNIRNISLKEQSLVFSPTVKLLYNFNRKSRLMTSYSYNEVAPKENNLFEGVILTSFRSFRNNEPDFKFLKTHSLDLNYSYHDFFKLTSFSVGINHNYRKNNFFSRTLVSVENTISTSFLLPTGNRDYSLYMNGEQYVHFLRTTIQVNGNYNLSFDKNVVNDSELRDVQMRTSFINLTLRPGLKGNFKFENTTNFMNNEYYLENTLQNSFSNLTNNFKITYNIKERLNANTVLSYLVPNLSENENYWFWDIEVRWTSKNKKFDYSIIARNLTNNKRFETFSASDYYRSTSSHNLLERFVIGSVSFRF